MSSNSVKYVTWYAKQNYDALHIVLPKGSRELIKEEAAEHGLTLNDYIKSLIPKRLICERKYIGKRAKDNEGNSGVEDSRATE